MEVIIKDIPRQVFITRKRGNKNTYLRVKEDLNIYITTNYFTKEKDILDFILKSEKSIIRMLTRIEKKHDVEKNFFYLGKEYDLIYCNKLNTDIDLEKWYKDRAQEVFREELNKMYKIFPTRIPYPSLTIRKMKTRWGVCNVKTKRITLNLELIKKDIKYLDYVIIHELSHLIYPNHSKDFWNLVSITIPNYKLLRKELNSYE